MIVTDVMDEIGAALDTIAGLRILPYAPDKITPPAAIVAYPDSIEFDETYQRGMDRITIPVVIVVGKVSARASRDRLGAYLDGSGPRSVKQVVDGATYTAADAVTAISAEVDVFTMGSVDYIAATFEVDIVGPGTT